MFRITSFSALRFAPFFALLRPFFGPLLWALLSYPLIGLPEAHAQLAQSRVVRPLHVRAHLVSETKKIHANTPFWIALDLEMDPEWHVYWKNPGDSGTEVRTQWSSQPSATFGEFQWPTPSRLAAGPLTNFGYVKRILLMAQVTAPPSASGQDLLITADARWLVCKESCIPEKAQLTLSLPYAGAAEALERSPQAKDFVATRTRLPAASAAWQSDWSIRAERAPAPTPQFWLWIEPKTGQKAAQRISALKKITFYPESWGPDASVESPFDHSALPSSEWMDHALRLSIPLTEAGAALSPQVFRNFSAVLVADGPWISPSPDYSGNSLHFSTAPRSVTALAAPAGPLHMAEHSFIQIFFFALIGGLLLNLMPCVFPVLSIKIFALVKNSSNARAARIDALYFSIGMIISFVLLAALLITLRSTGQQLGWGFQLQSPLIVTALIALFWALALNLAGAFEVGAGIAAWAATLDHQRASPHPTNPLGETTASATKSILSGVLASFVATPCTAPFMGTAMGYALAQSAGSALVVFFALGLGMATPYLLLAAKPSLLRGLPRPGRWMNVLKKLLSLPLFLTAFWLIWVLSQQVDLLQSSVLLISSGALLVTWTLLWISYGRWQMHRSRERTINVLSFLGVTALLAAVVFASIHAPRLPQSAPTPNAPTASPQSTTWLPFHPELIQQLRAEGRPVFIDFTAAWCVTCQVNKKLVLTQPDIQAAFEQKNVALMRADWTSYDASITQMLSTFGRSGVPLYVLYSPDPQSTPLIFPEVLTSSLIQSALSSLPSKGSP